MGALRPDRYYLLGDAGSFFFEPAGDNDGFESPEAAAEWARTQTVWPDLAQDLRDGVAAVVLGAEWNANQAAQEAAEAAGRGCGDCASARKAAAGREWPPLSSHLLAMAPDDLRRPETSDAGHLHR